MNMCNKGGVLGDCVYTCMNITKNQFVKYKLLLKHEWPKPLGISVVKLFVSQIYSLTGN